MSIVNVVCYAGRDLCDELITRTEESYWLSCVVVCDLETMAHGGLSHQIGINKKATVHFLIPYTLFVSLVQNLFILRHLSDILRNCEKYFPAGCVSAICLYQLRPVLLSFSKHDPNFGKRSKWISTQTAI